MVLVANRGEIARRIFRTCRDMGISTAAVYSDADMDARHVAEADVAVRLPGVSPAETYLRPDLLVDAALRVNADAVHPGYGFLSENAGFARLCAENGLTFVGPPPEAIEAMGSKLAAKAIMASVGVPTLPWTDVTDLDTNTVRQAAEDLGYPLLVKASSGGGGRGMRTVLAPGDLLEAVAAAKREAAAAFSDATVFLERLVVSPRHVEVQVLADTYGGVAHLFERECSIQRRYQKIIEECPSPAVDEDLRERLGRDAVAAAKAVGYVGAGTVEFVMDGQGKYYFLEMNTRLQVEHPVTELVTGLDLVRLQLMVAQHEPLPAEVSNAVITGHAVEARLYAEDPLQQFLPQTGTLDTFDLGQVPGVRIDSGVEVGSSVSQYYDPMVAKVIAWAPDRQEAIRKLSAALANARIHGLVTNRDLLVRILRHPEFVAGHTDTGFLTRHPAVDLGRPLAGPDAQRLHAVVATLALVERKRAGASVQRTVPAGWRNNRSQPQTISFDRARTARPPRPEKHSTGSPTCWTMELFAHTSTMTAYLSWPSVCSRPNESFSRLTVSAKPSTSRSPVMGTHRPSMWMAASATPPSPGHRASPPRRQPPPAAPSWRRCRAPSRGCSLLSATTSLLENRCWSLRP
ncbi:acetyl-CoA carboxylase biotin carboxylase subunit [Nocardioides sp. Soil796]|uniref:acetyl-CoA carboxylase biotin carboxylase subunit n=1 Tax=Nocardioides sp. Soil796 TaxID=1736412 RepID=UPI000AA121CF|nr:biotin carboxylase N-terminal domain-containing protein [Nocardioides sp. Soil796]